MFMRTRLFVFWCLLNPASYTARAGSARDSWLAYNTRCIGSVRRFVYSRGLSANYIHVPKEPSPSRQSISTRSRTCASAYALPIHYCLFSFILYYFVLSIFLYSYTVFITTVKVRYVIKNPNFRLLPGTAD